MTLILLPVGRTRGHMDFEFSFYWLDYETLNWETYAYWLNHETLNFWSLIHRTLYSLPSGKHWVTEHWISAFRQNNKSLNFEFLLSGWQWTLNLNLCLLADNETLHLNFCLLANNEHWTWISAFWQTMNIELESLM